MNNNINQNNNDRLWMDLFIITILTAIYFIIFLGCRNLSIPDEGRYPEIAREMLTSGNWVTPTINGVPFLDKPIMYYWIEALSLKVFGINAWGARMPMATFGFIGVILSYVFARKFYNRKVGLLTAAILACSPLYFLSAHYANLDLEVANFLWVSALLMLLGIQYPYPSNKRRYFLYGAYIFGALAFLTKGLMGFAFPAMAIGIWILLLNRWKILKEMYLFSGAVLFVIIITPWLLLAQSQNPQFLYYFFYYQQVLRFIGNNFHVSKIMGPWFYFLIMLIGMLPWSIYFIAKFKKGADLLWKNRFKDTVSLFMLIWSLSIFIFFSIPHTKLAGYILPILPTLAILMAKSIESMSKSGITKAFIITHSIGNSVLIIAGLALFIFPAAQHKIPMWTIYPTFIPTGIIIIIGAILSIHYLRANKLLSSMAVTVIAMMCFNIGVVLSTPIFDTKGSEDLTSQVLPLMQKNTKIISYENYKEDIPFLLQRKVYIVSDWDNSSILKYDNWKREFYFGITQYQQSHDGAWPQWYINKQKFLEMWKNNSSVFVFTSQAYFDQLKKILVPEPKIIAHKKGYVVFTKSKIN
ncbi:MAG: 4-amino-4-deoxy-L-arabinose transferase-like glycosyltransferase [Francisellaceae bacterium]|jgi:4-amino-4-deoxy-L-arabinose transferase-like glycosyltransferase